MEESSSKKAYRHYIYFLFSQNFSMLGSMIVGFSITWWITLEMGSEDAAVILSVSTFLMFLPQIIITPFSGVIADRWNKKIIIAISDSMQAFVTFLLFIFFLFDFQNIVFILGINTFRAALYAFQYPAVQSLVPIMVPKNNLSRINGINFICSGLVFSIGPILGAVLVEFFPMTQIFLIDVITFMIALLPLLIIRIPKVNTITEESTKKSVFRDFKTGLLTIKMIPGLFAMIAFAMIWNFISRPWAVLLPYFVVYNHGGTALNLALITTSNQIASIFGALLISFKKNWKHKIKINIIGGSIYFLGQIPAILATSGNFALMMISLFPGAFLFPITVSTYLAILQNVVPKDKVGRIMSVDHMISMAITPIGALIAGPLANLLGISNLFLICAIMGVLMPYFVWMFTKIRRLEIIDREKLLEDEKLKEIEELKEVEEDVEIVQVIGTKE